MLYHVGKADLVLTTARPCAHAAQGLRVCALFRRQTYAPIMQKTASIHHTHSTAGFFFGQSFLDECLTQVISDAYTGGAGPEKDNLLIAERRARNTNSGKDRSEGDGSGALNVVVKGEQLIAVAVEDGARVHTGEVFPLEDGSGQDFLDGFDEGVDK